jgi:hypothetical protein
MKTRLQMISQKKYYLFVVALVFQLLTACGPSDDKAAQEQTATETTKLAKPSPEPADNDGTLYSEQEIEALVNDGLSKNISIDTARALVVLKGLPYISLQGLTINKSWVEANKSLFKELTASQKKLLNAEYAIGKVEQNEAFDAYLLLTEVEPHRSLMVKWVTISLASLQIIEIALTYQYGSEIMEKEVSSVFEDKYTFKRTTKVHYHYIPEIGKVDSTEIYDEAYYMDAKGDFVQLR